MTTAEIIKAADLLHAGELVAFPTETVYGLGADAMNEQAIRKVFAVKGRPYDHPLIVHLANIEQLNAWAREIPPQAFLLAKLFWPGPLTLILKKQPRVLNIVTGNQDTVGIRIPNHPIAQALLNTFGGGIVAPSANKFTHVSPTTSQAVKEELGDEINLILDGGACSVGLESTIVDMSGKLPVILRPGMITAEALEKVLGVQVAIKRQEMTNIRAPGMHHLHYAPTTKTRLIETAELPNFLQSVSEQDLPAALVTYSDIKLTLEEKIHHVKMSANPTIYAHDLYHTLRSLDSKHLKQIIIESVPQSAEWEAIRDRLFKATAER